jgi:hypothetical protein
MLLTGPGLKDINIANSVAIYLVPRLLQRKACVEEVKVIDEELVQYIKGYLGNLSTHFLSPLKPTS